MLADMAFHVVALSSLTKVTTFPLKNQNKTSFNVPSESKKKEGKKKKKKK
jgi:hypothetical protein